jgi:hypothetical protein
MSYVKLSVSKPGSNQGVGGNKKDKITVFDFDDVQSPFPSRDSKGIVIDDNINFKAGAYAVQVYATLHTIKSNPKSEGDPDNKGAIQSVAFDHPGDEIAILEFRANWQNRNVGIVVERCSDGRKMQYGSPCAPLQMQWEQTDDKDKNSTTFTFTSSQKGPDVAVYNGTITMDTVAGTVAADATSIDLANGPGEYQMTDGTASAVSVTDCTNAVDNMTFTLLGSGGTHPSSIAAAATSFLLRNGTTWTAIAGSRITFKAIKDGASSYKYIELSRS